MIEKTTVKINGQEYVLKCSIATAEYFERLTGKKFSSVLTDIVKMQKQIDEEPNTEVLLENLLDMQTSVVKMAYCMILEANRDGDNAGFTVTYPALDDWLRHIGSVDMDAIKGVLAEAQSLFPRALQKRTDRQEVQ